MKIKIDYIAMPILICYEFYEKKVDNMAIINVKLLSAFIKIINL